MRVSTFNTNQRMVALLNTQPASSASEVPQLSCAGRVCITCRLVCSRAVDNLDRFAMRGQTLPQPLPAPAAQQIRRLRIPAVTAGLLGFCSVLVQFRCVDRGWDALDDGVPEPCKSIHEWLWAYCLVLTVMPFCQAFAGPLLLGWAAFGLILRSHSEGCAAEAPKLYNFVDTMLYHAIATCALMALCLASMWYVRHKARSVAREWAPVGPLCKEVLRRILADDLVATPADMVECSICLEGTQQAEQGEASHEASEAGSAKPWCKLRCGHAFHQPCLVEWLRRSRQCPLCRVDLPDLYPAEKPRARVASARSSPRSSPGA